MKFAPAAVAASIALVVGSLLVAAPADAVTCSAGRACLWKDTNYLTAGSATNSKSFSQYLTDFSGYSFASGQGPLNDNVTSLYNNGSSETAYFYEDADGYGPHFTLARLVGDGSLANAVGAVEAGHNDALSSGYFSSYNPQH